MSKPDDENRGKIDVSESFGGILDGMTNLLGKIGELAEKGEALKKSQSFQGGSDKSVAGSYGFSVKFGPGGERNDEVRVTPTETAPRENKAPEMPEAREPQVDVFFESDHILVVAEMPGVRAEDIELDFSDNRMTLAGRTARVTFEKTVHLEKAFSPDDVDISMNNGVVEIQLKLVQSDAADESPQ